MTRTALFVLAALLCARQAGAQDALAIKARATRLFDEARERMKAGDYAAACPKLAESLKLDPAVGTELNLGTCYKRVGRTASAWAAFKEAATSAHHAGQADRETFARAEAAALDGTLATLRVDVPSAVDGLVVTVDGVPIGTAEWGAAAPVDPGSHVVTATAPQRSSWRSEAKVDPQAKVVVTVPALAAAPAEAPLAAVLPSAEPAVAGRPRGQAQRVVGLFAGGSGIVGLALGTGFALEAESKNDDANKLCPHAPACASQQGVSQTQQAESAARVATGAFIAGGVLLAGGAVIFFTAPRGQAPPSTASLGPLATPHGGGLSLSGEW